MDIPKDAWVWVAGGRDYADKLRVFDVLTAYHLRHHIAMIVHGACKNRLGELAGADGYAEQWAIDHEVPYIGVPAQWSIHGRSAGPIRNRSLDDQWQPDYLIAFPGGRGTQSAIEIAQKRGIPVIQID